LLPGGPLRAEPAGVATRTAPAPGAPFRRRKAATIVMTTTTRKRRARRKRTRRTMMIFPGVGGIMRRKKRMVGPASLSLSRLRQNIFMSKMAL
jgi:hypothetical protein